MSEKPTYEELEQRVRALEAAKAEWKKTEAELRESRNKYRALFEAANDAIFVASAETGIILDANPKAEQLTGRHRDEIVGMHQTALHPRTQETYAKTDFQNDAKQKQTVFYDDFIIQHADGRNIPVEISPSFVEMQGTPCVLGIFRDVTEKKKAQDALMESERKYRLLADNAEDVIWTLNADLSRYTYMSPSIERLSGFTVEEFTEKPIDTHATPDHAERVRNAVAERLQKEKNGRGDDRIRRWEAEYRKKNGELITVESITRPLRDENGVFQGLVGVTRDITERVLAEKALKENEKRLRTVFETISDAVYVHDVNGHILDCNRTACERLGYSREEMLRLHVADIDLDHPAEPAVRTRIAPAMAPGPLTIESRHGTKDGRVIDVELRINTFPHPDRELFVTVASDITDRKQAEEKLKKSEERFRRIVETAKEGIWVVDAKWKTDFVNARLADMLGYHPEEMIGRNILSFMDVQEQPRAMELMTRREQGISEKHDFRFQRRDGTKLWTIVSANAIINEDGQFTHALAMLTDITDRKRAEQALQRSEKRFRAIFEQAAAGIATSTAEGQFLEINQTLCDILGYTAEELSEMTVYDVTFPEDMERQTEADRPVLQGKKDIIHLEKRFLHKGGHPVWTDLATQVIRDEKGNIQYVIGVVVDISERKQAEAELRESKALLEATGRMARVGGWELDPETLAVSWTEETYRIHEVPSDHMPLLEDALIFYPPDDRKRLSQATQRALNHGEPYDLEMGFVTAKDRHRWVRAVCQPVVIRGKTVRLSGTFQDITDRKNAELALRQHLAEKETLLREIHHRVKNNMQTIVGLLRMHARRTDDVSLKQIFSDCRDRITAMSLIHESLYQSDDLARIDFEAYLTKLCRNLGQAHDARGKGITLASDVDTVLLNTDQGIAVGLVVSELIANAFKHAFPGEESGSVTISVRNDGGDIELTVSDNGAGLPADFDIRNTDSLGLKLVEATVTRELGGVIDVERDSGARFVIRFRCENQR